MINSKLIPQTKLSKFTKTFYYNLSLPLKKKKIQEGAQQVLANKLALNLPLLIMTPIGN